MRSGRARARALSDAFAPLVLISAVFAAGTVVAAGALDQSFSGG
jgi:hypothetical protein